MPETIVNRNHLLSLLKQMFKQLDDDQEHLIMLVLNANQQLTGYKVICSGAKDHSTIDCRIIFLNAVMLGADAIILSHNHPCGNAEPSVADIEVTRKLVQAARILQIPLMGHVGQSLILMSI